MHPPSDRSATTEAVAPELRLLGGFALSGAGGPVINLPYDKVRALLAWLVLEPGKHAREALADMLWPEARGEQGRTNLRRALYDLRRACASQPGPLAQVDLVLGDKRSLWLNTEHPWQVDVPLFLGPVPEGQAAELAAVCAHLARYGGPLLAGLQLPDAPAFDTWLSRRREQCQERALALLEQLAELHEQAGQLPQALERARESIDLMPWRESLQRRYLRLLAQRSPAQALTHFNEYRRHLADELGIAPEADTLTLVQALEPAGARGVVAVPQAPAPAVAERRRLVVLVCDLAFMDDDDPEHTARRLAPLLALGAELIARHRGHVGSAEGGELQAYFGHPVAHERAPRHALDAAWALRAALVQVPGLRFGIGLHGGWTYVAAHQALPDASGALTKQARRLALAAPAAAAMVSPELLPLCNRHAQLGARSEWGAVLLGPLAGLSDNAMPSAPLPTLVGREAELAQLRGHWQLAQQGRRRAVLLWGEPGMGKTRLARALADELQAQGVRVTVLACQPDSAHTPYHPFLRGLHSLLGLPVDASPQSRHQGALRLLRDTGLDHPQAVTTLLRLLGLVLSADMPPPAERKRQEESLLAALFERLGHDQARVLLIEDLHWADPSTLDLLARMLSRSPALLLLCTARPAEAQLPGHAFDDTLALRPLPRAAVRELVRGLNVHTALTERQAEAVVRRADGVPLYAEELAHSLSHAPDEPIPPTLWDLLAARLDSQGANKRVAQLAAVIGRDFDLHLLQAAFAGEHGSLQQGLQALREAELIVAGVAPHHRFRHALIRDVAYQSLSRAERRELHQRVALALQGPCADRVSEMPELLARHLSEAGEPGAATYWLAAGRRSASQSAHQEARHHLEAGLRALDHLPEQDPLRLRLELPLQLTLGTTLLAAHGYGSAEAKASFRRALALAEPGQQRGNRFQALWGLWLGGRTHDDQAGPLEVATELAQVAARDADPAEMLQASYALGNNHFFLGELEPARQHLEAAVAQGDQVNRALLIARYGEDSSLCAQAMLGWVLCLQGDIAAAQAHSEACISHAQRLGHAHTLGYAMAFAAVLRRHLRQPALAAAAGQAVMAQAEEHGLALWRATGALVTGWAAAMQGSPEGLASLRQAVASTAAAMPSVEPTVLSFLADALVQQGQAQEALAVIDQGLLKASRHYEYYLRPEFLRLRGAAQQQLQAPLADVADLYREALAEALSMGALWLALRCTTSLSRVLRELGQAEEALDLLDNLLPRVQADPDLPHPDLPDLREALALQASLRLPR